MRELKFRAWDKKAKSMLPTNDLNFVIHPYDGEVYKAGTHGPDITDEYNWGMAEEETGDLIIMQYTGLKDKNGKEIYENDIVENKSDNKERFVIQWASEWGMFKMESISGNRLCHQDLQPLNAVGPIEVIGNINMNPELLNIKKETTSAT